jgi:HSP20 family protein
MDRFQRDFEDFWGESSRVGGDMTRKARRSIAPFTGASMPSVDIEDQGKNYRLTVDLPGFKKEDVQVELEEDSVTINARRSTTENEQNKNYIRRERSEQTFYRKFHLPEPVRSDQSNAKLNNGILDIMLPKKEPKETKKLNVM